MTATITRKTILVSKDMHVDTVVRLLTTQLNNFSYAIIKARGQQIIKALDGVEILKNKIFYKKIKRIDIKTSTETIEHDNKKLDITTIKIVLDM